LPGGNNAVFTPNASKTAATFTWTPTFNDGRSDAYNVTFTASNNSTGGAITAITVQNVDRAPVMTAPATASGQENTVITVNVSVSEPDAEPINALTADLSALPAGSNAVFTPNATKTAGTLTWTPASSAVRAAPYNVVFSANNALLASATTAITVTPSNALP